MKGANSRGGMFLGLRRKEVRRRVCQEWRVDGR